jgi:phenylacetate-CoA ligase
MTYINYHNSMPKGVKEFSVTLYQNLGTSVKRNETEYDHIQLRKLIDKEWFKCVDFCKKSPFNIKSWQFKRIKELVNHAYKTVPLYREKYSAAGFSPGDLKTWKDFEALPILTKDEIIECFPKKSVSSKHNLEFTTRSSGSSGKFVTIVVSPDAVYRDTMQGARQFYFQSGGKYGPDDLALFIYTCTWWVSSIDGDYKTAFLPTTIKVEEAAKVIRKLKPKILSLYPTYLFKFYEKKIPLKKFGVKLIIVHSEQSSLHERKEISKFMGIPVLDEFSSEELTRIALECPYRKYHLEEDACYVEIVNSKNKKKVKPGEQGLLIGTNLLNEGTPIIRYFQGDTAHIVKNKKCLCGSNFRIFGAVYGRYMDSIVDNNGEVIPASCFMDLAYNWYLESGIPVHGLRYQIIQSQDGIIDIYLNPSIYKISPKQQLTIKKSMYQLLPRDMVVKTHIVKELLVTTGHKFRPVVSFKQKIV